jgi:carbon starvation protein CstA
LRPDTNPRYTLNRRQSGPRRTKGSFGEENISRRAEMIIIIIIIIIIILIIVIIIIIVVVVYSSSSSSLAVAVTKIFALNQFP